MTTNVIDRDARRVATDSRWSFEDGHELHYVDDTNFDKIFVGKDLIAVFAGDSQLIAAWKEWIALPNYWDVDTPETEIDRNGVTSSIAIALITKPECELEYCRGVYLFLDGSFMFTGTGWEHALQCFRANKDIERCVESAKADDCTGGIVRIVDVVTGQGNLADPQKGLENIRECYEQRGFIMDKVSRKVTPVREAANDQSAAGQQVKELHFRAPTAHDSVPWSREDHVRLGKALERLKSRAQSKQQD